MQPAIKVCNESSSPSSLLMPVGWSIRYDVDVSRCCLSTVTRCGEISPLLQANLKSLAIFVGILFNICTNIEPALAHFYAIG